MLTLKRTGWKPVDYIHQVEIKTPPDQPVTNFRAQLFGIWLQAQLARVSGKSRLGEKLRYIHSHWDGLQVFLTDGRVEIDSNTVERTIRPIALSRKNALFAGHDEGSRNWGRIASLIETCKLNGVEPFDYIKATLEAIAAGHPTSQIDDLMPWAFKPASS